MKFISQKIPGSLLIDGERAALVMDDQVDSPVFVSYALVTQGPENHMLPSVLLDDWGGEIKFLELYRWFRENGVRFPRAEVFGVTPEGTETQYFIRDLELFSRYPTYASPEKEKPVRDWVLLSGILIPDGTVSEPRPIEIPGTIENPLREARVSWWLVPPNQEHLRFLDSMD